MSGGSFSRKPVKVPQVNTQYRTIITDIPAPQSIPIFEKLERYESNAMHGQLPIVWDKAEGFQVYDAWGNKWIDFTSTIFVANTGHGNPRIIQAIKEILEKPLLHTYTYATEIRAQYLQYLIEHTPAQFEKAFLLSAGTEATECALKLMRLYGIKKAKRRPGIICFEGNWHGRTLGAQMMGYNPSQKEWIGYLDPNIYHLPFPYEWRKEAIANPREYFQIHIAKLLEEKKLVADKDLCGFMIETFQGWGAVGYPPEFIEAIEKFARKHDMLITFDEMQAGFGRTGELFGYMHYNVEPDILCCGKGASSSLPLSLVLASKEIMDLSEIGSMSSTHSANPAACAAGLANLKTLFEDKLIERSKQLGQFFHEKLNEIKEQFPDHIRYVFGKGLVAGLVFIDKKDEPLSDLCTIISEKCMQKGLLVVHTGRESIKLAPPLTINREALIEGISTLREAVEEGIRDVRL